MAVTKLYTLAAVNAGGTIIGGITQQSKNLNNQVVSEARSGEIYSRFTSLVAQDPRIQFTTNAIAAALGKFSMVGWDIASNLILYYQSKAQGGTRSGGSVHRSITVANGLVVPRTLSVDHQGDATLQCEAFMESSDGFTEPFTISDVAALPTPVVDNQRFTLGTITLDDNATPAVPFTLTQFTSVEINFGFNVNVSGAESHLYPTFVTIDRIQPVITIRGIDPTWLAATKIAIKGRKITAVNTELKFRKREAGATFVADATAQHIKMAATGMAVIDSVDVGGPTDDAEATLTITCDYDGSNGPLSYASNATF